jgi:hypothetical protein
VATNKSCNKADFDWTRYKKAPRRLTAVQLEALKTGHLRPLLDYVLAHPEVRFDIRPSGANIYYDGGSLLQLEGGLRTPLRGIFNLGYVGEHGEHVSELVDAAGVKGLLERFPERREQMWRHRHAGHGRDERRNQQLIARANDGRAPDAALVAVDIEYANARRIFDLVCFDRAELPCPRLVLVELKCRGAALNGKSGLQEHAIDFCEFLRAEGGRHVELALGELSTMVHQKVHLGLLPADLGFEAFAAEPPEFLVLFADYDACRPQLTTPLRQLRREIDDRLDGTGHLRFADLGDVETDHPERLRLHRDRLMDAHAFEAHRARAH